jgi:hypothetical protein
LVFGFREPFDLLKVQEFQGSPNKQALSSVGYKVHQAILEDEKVFTKNDFFM